MAGTSKPTRGHNQTPSEQLQMPMASTSGRKQTSSDLPRLDLTEEKLRNWASKFTSRMVIGRGSTGVVYQGFVKPEDGGPHQIAIKRMEKKGDSITKIWKNEKYYLEKIKHPNIIKYFGCLEGHQYYYLVFTYMKNNICQILTGLTWDQALKIIQGVAEGLKVFHTAKPPLIHGDLKLENILVDKDFAIICNLASVGIHNEDAIGLCTQGYSSKKFIAKNLMQEDVFAFGTVLLCIISKQHAPLLHKSRHISETSITVHPMYLQSGCTEVEAKNVISLGKMCCALVNQPDILKVIGLLQNLKTEEKVSKANGSNAAKGKGKGKKKR